MLLNKQDCLVSTITIKVMEAAVKQARLAIPQLYL